MHHSSMIKTVEIKCNKRNVETVDLLVKNLLAYVKGVGEKLFI